MSLSDPDFLPHTSLKASIADNLDARDTVQSGAAKILKFPKNAAFQAATVSDVAATDGVSTGDPAKTSYPYRNGLKRIFDITLVLASAVIWVPFVLLAALAIWLRDGHSPFYTQVRVGRSGNEFRMLKLRSMVPNADAKLEAYLASDPAARHEWNTTQKLKSDPRITTLGRIIRKTSLDELPQLINVLNGDMSIVGPRPFMVSQRSLYHGQRYYDLRPGLTGFWQISNRNECNFAQRAHFDTAYYRAVSLKTDLLVIFRTVGVILRGTGY